MGHSVMLLPSSRSPLITLKADWVPAFVKKGLPETFTPLMKRFLGEAFHSGIQIPKH